MFGKTDKKVINLVCQCSDVPSVIRKLVIPLLLDILPSKRPYLSPPLSRTGGVHLDFFAVIVMLFSYADFVLETV